jgi:hypothetical protein
MLNKLKLFSQKQTYWKCLVISGIIFFNYSSQLAFAQRSASATASVTATIITPIGINKTTDMNFGNIIAGSSSGTVSLDPAGIRSVTTGITLPAAPGTVTAATFQVTGQGNSTYTITLPTSAYEITRTSGSGTMEISNFTSSPSGSGTLISGTQIISVGATLTVGADQPVGVYTGETGFNVTVNYN